MNTLNTLKSDIGLALFKVMWSIKRKFANPFISWASNVQGHSGEMPVSERIYLIKIEKSRKES